MPPIMARGSDPAHPETAPASGPFARRAGKVSRREVSMRRAVVVSIVSLVLAGASGCAHRERRRERNEPAPAPAPQRAPAEPGCEHADGPHKWAYYPDEPLYFCDRHQHHWIKDGRRWRHVERYDARPNYAAHMLANQSEFEIHRRHDEHAREFPPGSRRR